MNSPFENINKAFSKQSSAFDEYDKSNPILQWMRLQTHQHVMKYLQPGQKMLELNAGTGIDAVFFAQKEIYVHAIDIADGMLSELEKKIKILRLNDRVSFQKCSFTELHKIQEREFDYVFSNFGGLNCASDLSMVIDGLKPLLKPGARLTFVIMPSICPWEILSIFKGNLKMTFRRFKRNGVLSHLEGFYFNTYYYSPAKLIRLFGKDYHLIKLQGLGSISPPPYKDQFSSKFPGIYKFLTKAEEKVASKFPFNSWADHIILTMQYLPFELSS